MLLDDDDLGYMEVFTEHTYTPISQAFVGPPHLLGPANNPLNVVSFEIPPPLLRYLSCARTIRRFSLVGSLPPVGPILLVHFAVTLFCFGLIFALQCIRVLAYVHPCKFRWHMGGGHGGSWLVNECIPQSLCLLVVRMANNLPTLASFVTNGYSLAITQIVHWLCLLRACVCMAEAF